MSPEFDSEEEKIIYEAIKEYLDNNRFFKLKEVIKYLRYNLSSSHNIDNMQIQNILRKFIRNKLIVFRSKLLNENILTNDVRNNIYLLILEKPGIYLNKIIKKLEIGINQALWHLKILLKFNFISSTQIGKKEIYYSSELSEDKANYHYYLRNDIVKKIINLMSGNGSLKPTQISQELNIHYNTTKKYLKILKELNIILEKPVNKSKVYQLDSETYNEVLQKLEG